MMNHIVKMPDGRYLKGISRHLNASYRITVERDKAARMSERTARNVAQSCKGTVEVVTDA